MDSPSQKGDEIGELGKLENSEASKLEDKSFLRVLMSLDKGEKPDLTQEILNKAPLEKKVLLKESLAQDVPVDDKLIKMISKETDHKAEYIESKTLETAQKSEFIESKAFNKLVQSDEEFLNNKVSEDEITSNRRDILFQVPSENLKEPAGQKQPRTEGFAKYLSNQNEFNQSTVRRNNIANVSNLHKADEGAGTDDPLQLAVKNESETFDITSKGNTGFQMESNNSRVLMPKALFTNTSQNNVIDLSQLDSNNKTELMNKLVQEIEQGQLNRKGSLDFLVKHHELGNFKVSVSKVGIGQQVDLQILSQASQAHQFFSENEIELLKTLDRSGIKVSEFRLMMSSGKEFSHFFTDVKNSSLSNGQEQSSQSSKEGEASLGHHDTSKQEDEDSQRRKALWEKYRDQFTNNNAA